MGALEVNLAVPEGVVGIEADHLQGRREASRHVGACLWKRLIASIRVGAKVYGGGI
jgi:hypothetical protein